MRVCLSFILLLGLPAEAKTRVGLAAGLMVPVELRVDGDSPETTPGPLLVVSFDDLIRPDLDLGIFLHVGSLTAGERDEQINLVEFGGAAHWLRPLRSGATLRLGGGVGYRRLFADVTRYDRVAGLAVNADVEYSRTLFEGLVGQIEVGGLSQPWGSNGDSTVAWFPMPYLTVGAVF